MLRRQILQRSLPVLSFFLKNVSFTIKTGIAKGLRRRYGFGSKPRLALTDEEKFLMSLALTHKTVFDVGSYIGMYTLFFAQAVGKDGQVIAIEPNPRNYEEMCYNIALNGFNNVTPIKIGLGRRNEKIDFAIPALHPTRGTFLKTLQEQMQQFEDIEFVKMEVRSLDSLIEKMDLPRPDFIKIDVEGLELDVLYGMLKTIEQSKPMLFIEIHGKLSIELVTLLDSKGYSSYHIETQQAVALPLNTTIINGHLLCE